MVQCCVPLCRGKGSFNFPKDRKRRDLWERVIGANFRSSKSSRLCYCHFDENDFMTNKESYYTGIRTVKRKLKPNAIPSRMLMLSLEKSERAAEIRKALFEEDSTASSSLPLSPLDHLVGSVETYTKHSDVRQSFAAEVIADLSQNSHLTSDLDHFHDILLAQAEEERTLTESTLSEIVTERSLGIEADFDVPDNMETEEVIWPHESSPSKSSGRIADIKLLETDILYDVSAYTEETIISSLDDESSDNQAQKLIDSSELSSCKFRNDEKQYQSVGTQAGCGYLSISGIAHRDDIIHYYTGLETYAKFRLVYGTVSPYVHKIRFINAQVNCMVAEDMMLLTLMKLRRNTPDFELGFLFGISKSVVANIFKTWIHFIHQLWSSLDTWPSREVVNFFMPKSFRRQYSTTRVIVDATEIPISKPSHPKAQQATFSTYKNRNTVKVLVGATPDGLLSYCSPAYGGSTSDRQIIERSNLIQLCQKGDSIMADRGFNVQDICALQGVAVNIPHFLKGKHQLPGITVLSDRKLSSKRVHIERLIGLIKTYTILQTSLNPYYTKLATKIFSICLMLCNFREGIVSREA